MIRIYIIGLSILVIAILANGIVIKLGITSWYDFINLLSKNGNQAFTMISIIDYIWLFIAYPLVLGFGYWVGDVLHRTIFG